MYQNDLNTKFVLKENYPVPGHLIKIRPFLLEEDYPMLCQWWNDWKSPATPITLLPREGFVGYYGDEAVWMAFILQTDSSICLFEYPISNKKFSDKLNKGKVFKMLFAVMEERRKELGYIAAFSFVSNKFLIKRMEDIGAKNDSKNIEMLIWGI